MQYSSRKLHGNDDAEKVRRQQSSFIYNEEIRNQGVRYISQASIVRTNTRGTVDIAAVIRYLTTNSVGSRNSHVLG